LAFPFLSRGKKVWGGGEENPTDVGKVTGGRKGRGKSPPGKTGHEGPYQKPKRGMMKSGLVSSLQDLEISAKNIGVWGKIREEGKKTPS